MTNKTAFELLQSTLKDGRNLNLLYFPDMDAEISAIDSRLRLKLKNAANLYEQIRSVIKNLKFGEITIINDDLLLTTIVFRASADAMDFYSIGPFRSVPIDQAEWRTLKQQHNLSTAELESLIYILRPVVCGITQSEAVVAAKNILRCLCGVTEPKVKMRNFIEEKIVLWSAVPEEDVNHRAERLEIIYQHEGMLMDAVRSGDTTAALREAKFFVNTNMNQRFPDHMLTHYSLLISANTQFRREAQKLGIHPLHLDDISRRYARKLSLCTTYEQLNATYHDMICEYCMFCRTYATEQYSPTVQKAVNYIHFNLSEELTPQIIAEHTNFTPAYISRKFKEEIGMTLMNFVTQERVKIAKELLSRNDMTIKEVASYVGIPDWNYFTKIFKKIEGVTPTEYRNTHE